MELLRKIPERFFQNPFYVFLLIFCIVLAVYFNALSFPFIFDDSMLTIQNQQVQKGIAGIPEILGVSRDGNGSWHFYPPYRPIRLASYAFDFQFFNTNPAGYRFMNFFYHSLASLLVYLIALRLLQNASLSLFAALLFALHPVQTDSVTYISGRRDILTGLFYFLGFYWFLLLRQTAKKRYLFLFFLAYILAFFSKEMAITLPLVCLAYDFVHVAFVRNRHACSLRTWKRVGFYALGFLLAAFFAYYTLYVAHASSRFETGATGSISDAISADPAVLNAKIIPYAHGAYQQFLLVMKIFASYLKLLVFPYPLVGDYSYNAFPIPTSIFNDGMPAYALTCFLFILFVIYAWYAWGQSQKNGTVPEHSLPTEHWPLVTFSLLWLLITLLPVLQLIPHHELFCEHYLYIPLMGFSIAISTVSVNVIYQKIKVPAAIFFVLLTGLSAAGTIARNGDWKSELNFWTAVVTQKPNSVRGLNNLGVENARKGRFQKAISLINKAVGLVQNVPQENNKLHIYETNLAAAYRDSGQVGKAVSILTDVTARKPNNEDAWIGLGQTYAQIGKCRRAIKCFQKALTLNSNNARTHKLMSEAYKFLRNGRKADEHLKKSIALQENNPASFYFLAKKLIKKGAHKSERLFSYQKETSAYVEGKLPDI